MLTEQFARKGVCLNLLDVAILEEQLIDVGHIECIALHGLNVAINETNFIHRYNKAVDIRNVRICNFQLQQESEWEKIFELNWLHRDICKSFEYTYIHKGVQREGFIFDQQVANSFERACSFNIDKGISVHPQNIAIFNE